MATSWTNINKNSVLEVFLLQEDGTSFILQEDGTSKLLTEESTTWTNITKS